MRSRCFDDLKLLKQAQVIDERSRSTHSSAVFNREGVGVMVEQASQRAQYLGRVVQQKKVAIIDDRVLIEKEKASEMKFEGIEISDWLRLALA